MYFFWGWKQIVAVQSLEDSARWEPVHLLENWSRLDTMGRNAFLFGVPDERLWAIHVSK
jgi:hypothetical protein